MSGVSRNIDRFGVVFDDESLVADAGLLAAGVLMGRLGVVSLVDATVRLGRRVGAAAPGRKVATLVVAMLVGATHIDHVDRLRAGRDRCGVGFRAGGAVDGRVVPARVHVGSRPPTRQGCRGGAAAGVGSLWVPETRPWSLTCRDAGRC